MLPRLFVRRTLLIVFGTAVAAGMLAGGGPNCSAGDDAKPAASKKQAAASAQSKAAISGREIFVREWLPNDPRSHGGDGLGPVFNDSSCVACHNQGGEGGAGPASKNVDIVSAALNGPPQEIISRPSVVGSLIGLMHGGRLLGESQPARQMARQIMTPEQLETHRALLVKEARRIHPGFSNARSVVVHKFGLDEGYEKWRLRMTGMDQFFGVNQAPGGMRIIDVDGSGVIEPASEPNNGGRISTPADLNKIAQADQAISAAKSASFDVGGPFFGGAHVEGNFTMSTSQRNPTALFGAGLIDSIPVAVLEEAAARKFKDYPEVTGRVAKLPGDKIGRFGWKAQKASLYEFTMTACAVELGLNVPDHPQSGLPNKPDYKPAGFDLNQEECDALVKYLRELPAPAARRPAVELEANYLSEGKELFASVGCTACHVETLGEVNGIYSDLLLHDMGPELGDTGSYGVFIPDSPGGDAEGPVPPLAQLQKMNQPEERSRRGRLQDLLGEIERDGEGEASQPVLGAGRLEWRTPPLWGVRESAPYLHDGRAKNLEQAIAFHGGEATRSARRYFMLSAEERHKVQAFLKSLVAPTQVAER